MSDSTNERERITDPKANEVAAYRDRLAELPPLTPGQYGEHAVRTDWIGGIYIDLRHDPNTTIELCRWAEPSDGTAPADIDYEVRLSNDRVPINLTIEGARLLGACLLQAAATATRDLAENYEYLQA